MLILLMKNLPNKSMMAAISQSRRNISLPDLSRTVSRVEKSETPTPFSQSPAYYGRDRLNDPSLLKPLYVPSYYDSKRFSNIRMLSYICSLSAVYVYIFYFREPRDLDSLLEMDPRLVSVTNRKHFLYERMRHLKANGRDTRDVEYDLLETLAFEAEVKAELEEKKREASTQSFLSYTVPTPPQVEAARKKRLTRDRKKLEEEAADAFAQKYGATKSANES